MNTLHSGRAVLFVLLLTAVAWVGVSAQTMNVMISFNGTNGQWPEASPIQATDGNFYGTTAFGGPYSCAGYYCGNVYKIDTQGNYTVLYNFQGPPDGWMPIGELVQGSDGYFYGTTEHGGNTNSSSGTIFKISPGGAYSRIYTFCTVDACPDGANPEAGLVKGSDGNFYGVTRGGGAYGDLGTVFKITPSGGLTTLHSFNGNDGQWPLAALIEASDGYFYGTTSEGANNGVAGTVFKISSSGAFSTVYSFCSQTGCTDGASPYGGVIQGTDGNFYGTTDNGGDLNCQCGMAFMLTPQGTLTNLHAFTTLDGIYPEASLLQGPDGNFYGTTETGGAIGGGTIFRVTSSGGFAVVYNFCSEGYPGCPDGSTPYTPLTLGSDRNLYGATYAGGANDLGEIFQLTGVFPPPEQLVTVTPCRLLDTRQSSPIPGGSYETFNLPALAQQNGCAALTSAAVYSLNVTVVPVDGHPLGYLTIWPAGRPQPVVSTLNSPDGRIKANAAIVPAGSSGAVSVYVTDTTDVILDIDGYFATPGTSTLAFYPLTPCRVIATRGADGDLGGPYLQAQVERDFPVLESSCIPSGLNIAAYSMNFTVVPRPAGQPLGYLTVWPRGGAMPVVSTLNNPTATVVANAAVVPAGTDGGIATWPYNSTDLIVDIDGYFATAQPGGLSLYPTTPCRVLDTRANNGLPFTGQLSPPPVVLAGACEAATTAQAYVFNATVVPSASLGYLTLWPDGSRSGMPVVSTLNAYDGFIASNMAIVPNIDGAIDAFAGMGLPGPGSGYTQLILDISSYFAP